MRSVTTGFASLTLYSATRLFLQDKKKSLPKVGGNIFGFYLLGKMFLQLAPEYLAYFKRDFHPSEIDYTKLIRYWKRLKLSLRDGGVRSLLAVRRLKTKLRSQPVQPIRLPVEPAIDPPSDLFEVASISQGVQPIDCPEPCRRQAGVLRLLQQPR